MKDLRFAAYHGQLLASKFDPSYLQLVDAGTLHHPNLRGGDLEHKNEP